MKCELQMGVSYKLAKMLLNTNVKVQTFFHQSLISTAFKMPSICTFTNGEEATNGEEKRSIPQ